MENIFLGIGSNMDDPVKKCLELISLLKRQADITLKESSSFYRTEPVGYKEQDWFINLVVRVSSGLRPEKLLIRCKEMEKDMGRKKSSIPGGPRAMDIDILFYDRLILDTEELTIPHPGLHLRKFVLLPLNEINKDFIHPVLNKSVSELLSELKDNLVVEKLMVI